MLSTLLKLGEWQSRGKSKWDRFLDFPKVNTEDTRGNSITNYTLPIIFDLDKADVIIDVENLKEYDESEVQNVLSIKLMGPRSKKIATALPSNKLNQLYLTFFGKEDEFTDTGELIEAIEKDYPDLLKDDFKEILNQILQLKEIFTEKTKFTKRGGNTEISIDEINRVFELGKNEEIVFLICQVKSSQFSFENPVSFSAIKPYNTFLEKMYFPDEHKKDKEDFTTQKLCYASGERYNDVKELNLTDRYSLNKMFVTSTQNYASLFDKNKFDINYQVSAENQDYLDYASDYLLKQGYKVRIANLDHVIVPQFLSISKVDLEMALEGIQRKSDLLFNLKRLDAFAKNIQDWLDKEDEIFWINFIAFESDGTFFKSTEIIKDVSRFHFDRLNLSFYEIDKEFQEYDFVNWREVLTSYDYDLKKRTPHRFNFNSLFKIIPLRKDKEKKNKALDLFKTILENRKIETTILYDYFTELILCHYYQRYNSYTNVQKYANDYFYIAVRDSVFQYLAFIQLLKKLNILNMETTKTNPEKTENQYDKVEQDFFEQMNYTQEQRAMFYLGRMLNNVEYLQHGKNKTVIQKVNFNGMDKDSIQRLRIDLIEKAKQYNEMNKVVFTDHKFGNEFDFNNWNLSPQEAIFFLLTGYSFRAGKKSKTDN